MGQPQGKGPVIARLSPGNRRAPGGWNLWEVWLLSQGCTSSLRRFWADVEVVKNKWRIKRYREDRVDELVVQKDRDGILGGALSSGSGMLGHRSGKCPWFVIPEIQSKSSLWPPPTTGFQSPCLKGILLMWPWWYNWCGIDTLPKCPWQDLP